MEIIATSNKLPWYFQPLRHFHGNGNLLQVNFQPFGHFHAMEICWQYYGKILEVEISMICRGHDFSNDLPFGLPQITPASSSDLQDLKPSFPWRHSSNELSFPVHSTLSKTILPTPWTKNWSNSSYGCVLKTKRATHHTSVGQEPFVLADSAPVTIQA